MKTSRSTIQLRHISQLNHHPALFGTEKWKFSFLLLMLFFLVLFLPGFLFAQSPVAHYPLDGNGNDVSGNSLNGTIVGTLIPTTDRFGNANAALNFSGSGQVDVNSSFTDQNFSVSMWLKPGATQNTFANIIDNNHTGFQNWVCQQVENNTNQYNFGVHTSGGGIGVFFNLIPDAWQQVVLVKSASAVEAYVNGNLVDSEPWSGTVNYTSQFFRLGNWGGGGRRWNGSMDQVQYFNQALSASEILQQFQLSDGLIAYYPFSGNASDAEGSLNGTVNGATLTSDRFGNPNSAYQFDGVNDAISFSSLPMNNIDNFTLMAWVNPSEFDAANQFNRMIVSLGPGDKGYNYGMGNASGSGAGNQLGGLYNFVSWLPSGSFFSNPNRWYHTAMVRENGVTKFYLDGVLAPNTFTATPNQMTTDFQIGGQASDPTHFWKGGIDEVKIYNSPLTNTQIQEEITSGSQAQHKPGSGNALSFNGSNQEVNSTQVASTPNNFTMEAWVNPNSTTTLHGQSTDGAGGQFGNNQFVVFPLHGIALGSGSQNAGAGFSVGTNGICVYEHGDSYIPVLLSWAGTISGWTHVSIVYTNKQPSLYVNGILVATGLTSLRTNVFASSSEIGGGAYGHFNGAIDEVRIWNSSLSQTQIRDRMCRKITSGDALFSNLVAYYNFDESNGNTVFDGTSNTSNGSLTNGPTRITSGAAIGNSSSHNYVATGLPAVNLSVNGQDNLAVTLTSGTFTGEAGTHIYAVSEKPNTESGIENPGSNDRYFGVFHAGISNPQYTATYNYSGNSFVTAGNEGQLGLFKRNDNAGTAWTDANATINTTANTLTVSGQSTEYVLGEEACVPPAVPTITSGGQTSFCANASLGLISSSATGNQWIKDGSDIPGATSNTLTATTAGTYAVRVSQGSCSSTSTNLVLTTKAVPTFTISPSAPAVCEGNPVVLSTSGSTLASREWLKDGATTNLFGTTFSASVAGSYSAIGTAANGCTATCPAIQIQIDAVPVLSSDKPANTVCNGNPIVLSVSSGASFLWSNSATTSSITISPNADSEFSVRTTGALGCVFSDTIQVLVVPNLTPGTVSNVLPENGSINQENSLDFSWQPSSNTISYDLFVWPAPGSRPASAMATGITGISTHLSNLNFGTLYNVQVVSRSACQSTNGPLQQLTTRSLPDLSLSNIVSQASLGTPGILSVTYTVTNAGTGVSLPGSWTDRLYLSVDSTIGNDILIGSKPNVNALAGGSSYNGSFQIPVSQFGEFFLYVQTDASVEVIEANEGNNVLFRNPGRINFIQANPSPDLVGLGQAFTPSTAVGDQAIPFTYTVRNQGDKEAKGTFEDFTCVPENCLNASDFTWQDDVYISPGATFDGQAKFIGRATVNPRLLRKSSLRVCNTCNSYQSKPAYLEIDSSLLVSSNGLRIPHDYSGPAFLHIVVNGSNGQGAFDENVKQNNSLVSNPFTVILRPPADLAVGGVEATPVTTQQGNLVKVKYRVTNVGTNSPKASETPWSDRVYLSTTPVLNRATALVVYNSGFNGTSLNPNAFYNDSVTFQVPFLSTAPLFVFVETDVNHQVFEHTFEANNLSSGTQLNLDLSKKPDYIPSALVSASSAQSASDYPLSFTLSNSGNAAGVGAVTIHYHLKKTGSADAPTYLGESVVAALSAGSNASVSKTISIPAGLIPGNYEVTILADAGGIQPELNEGNNSLLKVISVSASPSFALSLNTITHPATIDIFQNQPSFDVSGQASFNLIQNGPGIPAEVLGKIYISQNPLGVDALYEKSFTLSFPGGIPASFAIPSQTINRNTVPSGNYFVVVKLGTAANGFDTDLADNTISQPVFFTTSPTPDIVMLNTPTSLSLASGSTFSIPLELKNLGVNELTGKVVTKAFLSNSPSSTQVTGIATLGSSFTLPGITSMPTNVIFKDTIRGSVPLSFSGNYFLQLVTEADKNTWEGVGGEANNIITIPVVISAPVLPDLRPDALALPATIEAGRTLSFNYTLRNVGAGNFSGLPKNTFRLSKLGVFNPITDGETGQHQTAVNLNAGGNVSLSSSMVVSGLLPGPYKPGVFANSNFGVIESNYTNNEVYATSTRNIFINPVNLNVTASENNFHGDYFYRSVSIGAGLDILAEFEGQAAFASNGKVPTSSTSDFVSPEDGTKELIIPNAEAGQYFIGVRPNASGITSLKVRALPFSIISLSPNKVGQGNATTEMKGAAFTGQTLFILLNGSGTVVDTGTIRQIRNSMQARVTFHCQSLPIGFYTVRAIKPGLDTFDLANGLQVLPKSTTQMVSTDNFPTRIAATATVPLLYQFTNAGNTDVENAFAKVSFPAFANVKNVNISTNADGLKSLYAKSGVYDLDSAVTHELYDFMTYVPAWKRNVAPGESFSIAFDMAGFSATSDLFAQAYAINLPDTLFYQQIANQIEKVRALSIQKMDEIEDQNIVDSIGGYWSFQRLAFQNLRNAGFFKTADVQSIKAYDYMPSLYQPNLMRGFGLVSNPNEAEDLSLRLLCVTDLIEYNLPTKKELYFDYNDGVFVTYSSNFRRTAQDLINSACDGDSTEFKRRLNGNRRGGKLVGNLTTGFVYGPIIYANIFGRFEPNAPKPGSTGQPSTQSDGGSFFGGDLGFNNRELFNQPPTPRRPPPPPPTKPAHKPFDPINQFGDPGELPHKKPDAECDGISIPQCEVHVIQPKKQRCGVEYKVTILRICHVGGDGRSIFCFPNTPFIEEKTTTVFYSCDPNEIVGPEGVGSSKFVSKSDSLPYTILFENDPEFASAAAGTVRISQPLDDNFEAGTLQLTQYGFGGKTFDVPTGQNSFSSQIDLSEEQGIKVNVLGTLDIVNKQLFWQFTTIDAATGLPSVDPSKGFLPVNDSTGKGEGFVRYQIMPGIGTVTGDSLRAKAEIFFDFNEPVMTNRHFNVVDAFPPVTNVTSPSGTQASTEVVLEWTTSDDEGGSGASQTWILYKKDARTLDTLGQFPADTAQIIAEGFETGHTYQFFFRSTDLAGNIEALPAAPQMSVVIGNAGPSFSLTAPIAGQTACSNDTLRIRWTTTKTTGNVELHYKESPSSGPVLIASGVPAVSGKFDWVNPAFVASGQAKIVLSYSPLDSASSGLFTSTVITKPVVTPTSPLIFCQGGSVILSTNAAAGHRWSNGATSASITISTTGTFADTAKAGGCQSISDPVSVIVNPLPVVNAGADVTIQAGDSAFLSAIGAASYQWSPLTGLSPSAGNTALVKAMPTQTTLYTVLGTDGNQCSASDQVLVTVTGVSGPLQAPVISPVSGTYDGPQTVTITTGNPGAKIYFTTTGNIPVVGTGFTKEYLAPFQVIQSTTIRAMVVKTGQANSPVAVSYITITNPGIVATPVISPGTGTFGPPQTITLSCATAGAQIWYTTTGNTPVIGTGFTKQYVGPFLLPVTGTVKAMAVKAESANSAVATAVITITNPTPTVATPVITPGTGIYAGAQSVNITCATPGATILYTTTGNVPVIGAGFTRTFSAPFVVNTSTTIRAMATAPGAKNSAVAVAYITIGPGREAVDNSLDESSQEGEVHVFPNPSSSGRFHIQLPENADKQLQFTVLSLDGKILWTASPSGKTEQEIDLSDWPSGLYLLKFHDGTSLKTIRLSKF